MWFIAGGQAACVPLHGQTLPGTQKSAAEKSSALLAASSKSPFCPSSSHCVTGVQVAVLFHDLAMMERKQSQSHQCELLLKDHGARSRITGMREGNFLRHSTGRLRAPACAWPWRVGGALTSFPRSLRTSQAVPSQALLPQLPQCHSHNFPLVPRAAAPSLAEPMASLDEAWSTCF